MGIIVFALCIVTVFLLLEMYKAYKRVQEIKETPTTDIRYLETGRFEIKAEISSESENIQSPLSQSECVWFCLIIKEHVKRGKSSSWVIRANEKRFKKCIVDDGSGKCEVELSHVDFDLGPEYKGKSGTLDNPTDEERNALQNLGLESTSLFGFNRTFKYEEYILQKGDNLYILGNCESQKNSDFDSEILLRGSSDEPLFLSDKSEADLISKYDGKVLKFGISSFLLISASVYILLFHL